MREEHKEWFVQEATSLSSSKCHTLTPASEASLGPETLGGVQPIDPRPLLGGEGRWPS